MKKSLILVLVAFVCLSAVYASGNAVKVSVVPYGWQITTSSADNENPFSSKYGIGLEASYQLGIEKGFYAEMGLGWNTFIMKDDRPAFTNILAFAGLGYRYDFNDKLSCSANAGVGTDTLIYISKASETVTLRSALDVSYAISDSLELSLGCRGTFGFAKDESANYVNYRILPVLGISYKF